MSTETVQPVAKPKRRRRRMWLVLPTAAFIAAAAMFAYQGISSESPKVAGQFYTVLPVDMDLTITRKGELDAQQSIEVFNKVEGRTLIVSIVPEGSIVKEGDVLMVLDSATIRQKIDDAALDLQRAQAELTTAREQLQIQQSTNAANLQAAKVELQLAQLDLQQYVEGSYPQTLAETQRNVDMARIELANRQKDLEQTQGLFAKGFVTAADVEKGRLEVLKANNTYDKARTDLNVLTKYTHEKDLTSKTNSTNQASAKVDRVSRENEANRAQKEADALAKEGALGLKQKRLDQLREQLEACTIRAPRAGMVIYARDPNGRDQIAEGSEVRERQRLLKFPESDAMKAVLKVGEHQVAKLDLGLSSQVQIVGVPNPVPAEVSRISVMADAGSRWWDPDLKEYPVELKLKSTPENIKPGTGVTVTIFIDRLKQVLAVPRIATYEAAHENYVFLKRDDQVLPVKVSIGKVNDAYAQIEGGIKTGDEVLLLKHGQGQELLNRAGIQAEIPQANDNAQGEVPTASVPTN